MDAKIFLLSLLTCSAFALQAQDAPTPTPTPAVKPVNLFGGSGEAKGPTIITANQEATFDSKANTASFTGNVQVQDPQFSLTCDRLNIQINPEQGGLKQADADGNVFIVSLNKSKTGGADEKSTGKGEHATYTTSDGLIILTGSPQIQQGGNTHIATEPGTKMNLFRDGRLQTTGASRTIIQNNANAAPK